MTSAHHDHPGRVSDREQKGGATVKRISVLIVLAAALASAPTANAASGESEHSLFGIICKGGV